MPRWRMENFRASVGRDGAIAWRDAAGWRTINDIAMVVAEDTARVLSISGRRKRRRSQYRTQRARLLSNAHRALRLVRQDELHKRLMSNTARNGIIGRGMT